MGGNGQAMRLPPHDVEAEQAVIGSLLIDQDAIAAIRERLEPDDFYVERHTHIYRAAITLADRGEPIDTLTLRSQLESTQSLKRAGGIDYIAEMSLVVPTSASVRHYADIVAAHALRRRLIKAGADVASLGFDLSLTTEAALDGAEQSVFNISD
ncbi:MAG TPA: DnaB-like helicase N-terminal domain-containing protein, partial [Candidatus Sulfotelmatobacter sp.]|nr:DnaB-like helicase N-terminal domain-containing protein [Candidatus Sulfotelmatobacter sp.]